jgi:multidrug resistance efflux pump
MTWWRWTVALVALGALANGALGASGLALHFNGRRADVADADVRAEVLASATLVPREGVAEIRPQLEGTVVEVRARDGDRVRKGQVLARIDSPAAQAELRRREAERDATADELIALTAGANDSERRSLEAQLQAARTESLAADAKAGRLTSLLESGTGSDAAAEQARLAAEQARERYESLLASSDWTLKYKRPSETRASRDRLAAAEAAVEAARLVVSRGDVASPVDGLVMARHVNLGDAIVAGAAASPPMFEIGDGSTLSLRAEIDEMDAKRVRAGLPVEIYEIGGNAAVAEGEIGRIGARLERRTIGYSDPREPLVRTIWVDVTWSGSDDAHPPPLGQRFEAHVMLPPQHVATAVPRGAVAIHDGVARAEVAVGPFWKDVPVEIGISDRDLVEVRGLGRGTHVLVVP